MYFSLFNSVDVVVVVVEVVHDAVGFGGGTGNVAILVQCDDDESR